MKNIIFFEVEKVDRPAVKKNFPSATIMEEAFSAKTVKKCKNAEILCGFIYSDFSAKNLKKCPNVKLIITRSVGYNHVDLKYMDENGIKVCNVPDYGSHVIAEHVFALLLASIRNVLEGEERTDKEKFIWKGLRGIALKGKTLGVIGTGKIGMNVCRIAAKGFLMNVIAYDKTPQRKFTKENGFKYVKSLNDIWKQADIISLHVPLFPSTEHMINEKSIKKMKDGVVIINTARGGLIDTKALIKGLKSGKISHTALDVIEHEKNIKANKKILHYPGVIITPHIAFYADDSMGKMFTESFASIERFKKKKKLIHQVHGR